jgi:hypothetical protein
MSYGLVICSACKREVHQSGDRNIQRGWQHCEDKTPLCSEATTAYPRAKDEIAGAYCGMDDLDHVFVQPRRSVSRLPRKF